MPQFFWWFVFVRVHWRRPTPCCGLETGQLFLCWVFAVLVWQTISWTQMGWVVTVSASAVRCQLWFHSVRSDSLGQRKAANDSMVLAAVPEPWSASPVALYLPLCLTVCEKYVPCGLVGAVKWWLSVWLLVEAEDGEEGRPRKDSNCVYGLNTIISPCDSEAEKPLCVTSHIITP